MYSVSSDDNPLNVRGCVHGKTGSSGNVRLQSE
jgi:hypothetical protein